MVLVFGSFTCNTFVSSIPDLNRLYDEFKDRVAFAMIVSADAGHVIPGFEFLQPNPETPAPGQSGKHCELLQQAAEVAGLRVPVFLDSPDYDACRAYKAWPARLVLVNSDGRVEYDFGPPVPSLQRWVMADVREAVRLLCTNRRRLRSVLERRCGPGLIRVSPPLEFHRVRRRIGLCRQDGWPGRHFPRGKLAAETSPWQQILPNRRPRALGTISWIKPTSPPRSGAGLCPTMASGPRRQRR